MGERTRAREGVAINMSDEVWGASERGEGDKDENRNRQEMDNGAEGLGCERSGEEGESSGICCGEG